MIAPLRLGYYKLVNPVFGLPLFLHFVFHRDIGGSYDIGPLKKACLILRFRRNTKRVQTLSTLREHLQLAAALLGRHLRRSKATSSSAAATRAAAP